MALKHMLRKHHEHARMVSGPSVVVITATMNDPESPADGAKVSHDDGGANAPFYRVGVWTVVSHPAGMFSYCVLRHDGTKLSRPTVYIEAAPEWAIQWSEGRPVNPVTPVHI